MSAMVTGEAVVLELRPASFALRGVGLLIDVAAQVLVAVLLFLGIGTVPNLLDRAAGRILVLTSLVLVFVAVPVAVETASRGKSLGKLVMGLRVVRDDGGALRFRHALIRALVGIFEIYLMAGAVAFIVSLLNDRSKRLGDMLAGTYSMRERVPAAPAPLAPAPAFLAGWVTSADLGRLPDGTARRVQSFLRQGSQLAPASRDLLAAELASEVASFVAPPPPAATPAAAFLAAVMAERRDRDYRRLLSHREAAARTGERLRRLPFGLE